MIYFDNAATSLIKPECVKNSVKYALENLTANPGRGGHTLSQMAGEYVYMTREKIKDFMNAKHHEVIFTKNCTEALNLAIRGILSSGDHVVTTMYEHNSVLRTLEYLKDFGVEYDTIDCDLKDFHVELKKHIKPNTKMVITTCVSNVTGDMCNIDEVGKICKDEKVIYFVDSAQAVGHVRIDIEKSKIDMLAFSGHKGFMSITGVGALIVRNDIKLKPLLFGGTGTSSENLVQPDIMPEGFESGTIPSIPIVSLYYGIDFVEKNFEKMQKYEEFLIKYLNFKVKNEKFLKIYSNPSSNILLFNIENLDPSVVSNELNDMGICVRSGLHCAPLAHKRIGTLYLGGAVRVSIDFNNTKKEIDELFYCLEKIYFKFCQRSC